MVPPAVLNSGADEGSATESEPTSTMTLVAFKSPGDGLGDGFWLGKKLKVVGSSKGERLEVEWFTKLA